MESGDAGPEVEDLEQALLPEDHRRVERLERERLLDAELGQESCRVPAPAGVGRLGDPAPALLLVEELLERPAMEGGWPLDRAEDEEVVVEVDERVGDLGMQGGGADVRDAVGVPAPARLLGRDGGDAGHPPGRVTGDPDSIVGQESEAPERIPELLVLLPWPDDVDDVHG